MHTRTHEHSMYVSAVFSFIDKSIKRVDSVQHTICLMFVSHIVQNMSMHFSARFFETRISDTHMHVML